MSFPENRQSLIDSEGNGQAAQQQLVNRSALGSPILDDESLYADSPEEELESDYIPELTSNSPGDDADLPPGTHITKHDETSEYDEDEELQSDSPLPPETSSRDRLSRYKKRERTIAERELASSMDYARSKDLSIHLYNSFKLKQAARASVPDENGFIESKEPLKGWTAWPMTPDRVPREHEVRKWEDPGWRAGPYVKRQRRPGDELRELLTARVLMAAKERLNGRQSVGSEEGHEEGDYLKPVITADDDVATHLLRPSIQHAMGKLDGVLMALHHARFSYATKRNAKKDKPAKNRRASSAQDTTDTQVHRGSSTQRGGDVGEVQYSDIESNVQDAPRPSKRQKRSSSMVEGEIREANISSYGRLKLRDWSDVLYLASISGVDQQVVQRAAARCADLFDE